MDIIQHLLIYLISLGRLIYRRVLYGLDAITGGVYDLLHSQEGLLEVL